MKKFFKGALFVAVSSVVMLTCGCKTPQPNTPTEKKYDSETRALQLSTSALDGNFNPFFYTSGNDGSMIAMTQIGLLTTDKEGHITCGAEHPTVALDYNTTMYDAKSGGNVTLTGTMDGRTEYEFLIKKGIKFSDGEDLTIKDVLFNMYVYLDPAYTGSATLYSTDIQGLAAYRLQDDTADDNADASGKEAEFAEDAQTRVDMLIEWAQNSSTMETTPSDLAIAADLVTVKELLREELTTDWTSIAASWVDSFKDSYSFTAAWQAYLFNAGLVTVQTRLNGNGVQERIYNDLNKSGTRDDGEPYYTTLDAPVDVNGNVTSGDPEAQLYISGIAEATTKEKVDKYMADNDCTEEYAIEQLQKDYCIEVAHTTYTGKEQIPNILTYWATATSALEQFAGEARTKYYEDVKKGGKLPVESIRGITTYQTNTFKGKNLDGTYDVLKVVVNGVDPKAIFNFGFSVAPMHYYADGTFSKDGLNYAEEALKGNGFGVCLGDGDFFKEILQDTSKNKLPVGAGAYKATTSSGGNPTPATFFQNGVVYFQRNTYFNTVGDGIENAKIKYVNYKELRDDQMMDALETQSLDFGTPNATNTNVNKVSQNSFLSSADYRTNGYGYVGVNPKFVPEYKIRQAIMKAMDTGLTVKYYSGRLAEAIYRPMSMMSWAYPTGVKSLPESVDFDISTGGDEIKQLVKDAGYTLVNGVYTKTEQKSGMANAANQTKLKLTFTLAGESTDHPAYQMFVNAAARLNAIGFDITVTNSATALRDMTSGNLAVWAAAWSSATDPDPYQVYHKDSKATSVNNWNYPTILKDNSGKWSYEQVIIERLSTKIDEGRETLSENTRKMIYAECLDLIMELAVELPTYQRSDLCVYNNTVIDANTLEKDPNCFIGLFDKLWEIDYV